MKIACGSLAAVLLAGSLGAGPLVLERRRARSPGLRGVHAERLVYRSGGCRVTAYLVRPKAPAGPLPVLLYGRGGFSSRLRSRFGYLAWLARTGPFVVLASQYRGHDGSDCPDELGGADVGDVMTLARLARTMDHADGRDLHLLGVSRGGAQALLALARGLEARSATVVGAPTDVAAMVRHLGPMRRRQLVRTLGGTPEQVPRAYAWRSPLAQAARIHTPVLLVHGAADPLVPASEARHLAQALGASGTEFRLELIPGAGHLVGGRRARTRDQLLLAWIRRHSLREREQTHPGAESTN